MNIHARSDPLAHALFAIVPLATWKIDRNQVVDNRHYRDVIFLAHPAPARASQVRIPLTIDYLTLREALKRKLYTAPGGRAELWNGLDDCQFLYAENPEFSRATAGGAATVKLETANSLGLGVAMGSQCLDAIQWSGIVEALGVPYIAPGLQLKFHFTDLNLYDAAHQKAEIVSKGFDLIKGYLIPRLNDFSYDLNPSVQQLAAMINDSIPADAAERVRAAIASLTADPNIAALDDGVRVTLVMTVPDMPVAAASPGAAASPPTPAELKAFQDTLDQWDAFLVFSIKQLGDAVGDQQFRDQLLQILLDSRYRLVQALNNPSAAADPIRSALSSSTNGRSCTTRCARRRGAGCSARARSNSCRSSRPATPCSRSIRPRPRSGCASRPPTCAASRTSWRPPRPPTRCNSTTAKIAT